MGNFEVTYDNLPVHHTADLVNACRAGVEHARRGQAAYVSDYDGAGVIVATCYHDGDVELELEGEPARMLDIHGLADYLKSRES